MKKYKELNMEKLYPNMSEDAYEGVLLIPGMESAFVGLASQHTKDMVAVYDRVKCLQCLAEQGMTEEEAEEYFGFNVEGAWVGEQTPMFIDLPRVSAKNTRLWLRGSH